MLQSTKRILGPLVLAMIVIQVVGSIGALGMPANNQTEVWMLDASGMELVWNTPASLGARLVQVQDNQPLPSQTLDLYLKKTGENATDWILYGAAITDETGLANFSFLVNLTDGQFAYKFAYAGQDSYGSSANESSFVVTGDPAEIWYLAKLVPAVTITVSESTDRMLSFSYSASISPPFGYWGDLTDIDIGISAGSYSGSSHVDIASGASYSSSYSTISIGGTHISAFYAAGTSVVITVTAYTTYSYLTVCYFPPFILIPWIVTESNSNSQSQTVTLTDDDTATPVPGGNYGFDSSKTLQSEGPYNVWFDYRDDSGWSGVVQYQFTNSTFTSPTYEKVAGSTSATIYTTMTYPIPKEEWSLYPGTAIIFRTKAIDQDNDGGREVDKTASAWSNWITAGYIYSVVGGRIESILYYISTDGNWRGVLVPITPDPEHWLYINDKNFIQLSIANPSNEPIVISNAILDFTGNSFSNTPPNPIAITGIQDPMPAGSTFSTVKAVIFTKENFILYNGHLYGSSLYIKFTFDYYFVSNPTKIYHVYSERFTHVANPPEPTIEALELDGTLGGGANGDKFILKTPSKEGNIIQVRFRVTNNARVPIQSEHNFKFGEGEEEDLSLLTLLNEEGTTSPDKHIMLDGGESIELEFSLKLDPFFFYSEQFTWFLVAGIMFKALGLGSRILREMAQATQTAIEYGGKLQSYAKVGAAINWASATYNSIIAYIAGSTYDEYRHYIPFRIETTWNYVHYGNVGSTFTTSYLDHVYYKLPTNTYDLYVEPSGTQKSQFHWGEALRIMTIPLYVTAGFAYTNPLSALGGAILSSIADAAVYVSNLLWNDASDDLPLTENYTTIFVPEYNTINMSTFEPSTEFDYAVTSLANSLVEFEGDIVALNETESRKSAALEAGDYGAVLLQNSALENYSLMIADDFKELKNDIGVMTALIDQNSSQFINSAEILETSIATEGLSQDEIEFLEDAGYNSTEIAELNQAIVNQSSNSEVSSNMTVQFSQMIIAVNASIPYINTEIERFENASSSIIQESIEIRTEVFHENITIADTATLNALEELQDRIDSYYIESDWKNVITSADQLYSLACETSTSTNNQSYILTYGEYAKQKKQEAEEFLKIELEHIPNIAVTPGILQTINLIVRSEGCPSGNYVLEVNSSWIGQNNTIIPITRYDSNILQLQIMVERTPFIAPGMYPLLLKVYLPQTTTIVYSILIIEVRPFFEVDANLTPLEQVMNDCDTSDFIISISNRGNVPDTYHLESLNVTTSSTAFFLSGEPLINDTLQLSPNETSLIVFRASPFDLGTDIFTIVILSDNVQANLLGSLEVRDDDDTCPEISLSINNYALNSLGGVDVTFLVDAIDSESGIDLQNVLINVNGTIFTSLGVHTVMVSEFRTYNISVVVFNADTDRGSVDQEISTATFSFTITSILIKGLILNDIENAKLKILTSADINWRSPALNRKEAMINKLNELQALVEIGDYTAAYDKLLHDIKPKLTGLKTDEYGQPCDGGIFNNPWVQDPLMQEEYCTWANGLLFGLRM